MSSGLLPFARRAAPRSGPSRCSSVLRLFCAYAADDFFALGAGHRTNLSVGVASCELILDAGTVGSGDSILRRGNHDDSPMPASLAQQVKSDPYGLEKAHKAPCPWSL